MSNIAWPELQAKIARWVELGRDPDRPFTIPPSEVASEREEKFARWIVAATTFHRAFRFTRNEQVHWTPLAKSLDRCRVSLISTGGIHLTSQPPFDTASEDGDISFREIPADAANGDFTITHTHYNHSDADQDINCMFPIERLRELATSGVIGEVAPRHFGLMGTIPNPARLRDETAPRLTAMLREDGVDLALLTPG